MTQLTKLQDWQAIFQQFDRLRIGYLAAKAELAHLADKAKRKMSIYSHSLPGRAEEKYGTHIRQFDARPVHVFVWEPLYRCVIRHLSDQRVSRVERRPIPSHRQPSSLIEKLEG